MIQYSLITFYMHTFVARQQLHEEMIAYMSSDQCGFPVFCCEKPLEEQEASVEYSTVEEESTDHNFGQVRGCNCNYCSHRLVVVYPYW